MVRVMVLIFTFPVLSPSPCLCVLGKTEMHRDCFVMVRFTPQVFVTNLRVSSSSLNPSSPCLTTGKLFYFSEPVSLTINEIMIVTTQAQCLVHSTQSVTLGFLSQENKTFIPSIVSLT